MIISQTPYRVSFAGGGTDLPAFYRHEYGAVLSTTIDHHMYVTIHRRFEPTIRVGYSQTETAARSTRSSTTSSARRCAWSRSTSRSRSRPSATCRREPGMGSSSSLTAGLLNALYAYRHVIISRRSWRSRPAGSRSTSSRGRSAARTSTRRPLAG